jgi:hypothetical protein
MMARYDEPRSLSRRERHALFHNANTPIFARDASDAVCLSGTDAVEALGLSNEALLGLCAGAPAEAKAVLKQLVSSKGANVESLRGISCAVLLDTGIRSNALAECGYSLVRVVRETRAPAEMLTKLGYTIIL